MKIRPAMASPPAWRELHEGWQGPAFRINGLAEQDAGQRGKRRTGLSRNTIRKSLKAGTIKPKFTVPERPRKLAPLADKFPAWLKTEASKSRKQHRPLTRRHPIWSRHWHGFRVLGGVPERGICDSDAKSPFQRRQGPLGSISKMGNRHIRRLLYLGAMDVISAGRRLARAPVRGLLPVLSSVRRRRRPRRRSCHPRPRPDQCRNPLSAAA